MRTALASQEEIAPQIRTVGFAQWDEHRTAHIHTRVEGWIEQIEVRAIGDRVAKGDLLFALFSPEVGAATAELVRAIQTEPQSRIVEIAKNRLRSIGLQDRQIERIASTRQAERNIEVYAPQDGVVVALEAAEGMYLKPDVRALSLTDPAKIWVTAEVFERDTGRMSEGMRARAQFDSLPEMQFSGQIDYIYPELDPKTRTLPVRVILDNSDGKLRPGMFSSVTLEASDRRMAVTVPSEAVIRTGRAERVILKSGEGVFRPRLITTGLRDGFGAGGRTEVIQGLAPGEEIVASAQFLIDSESVLNAGMMRMAPTEADPVSARGNVLSISPETRKMVIAHEPVAALDWPAMETGFTVARDVLLDGFAVGDGVEVLLHRGADGQLWIGSLTSDDGVAATGQGIASAITADGRLSISHDPIPELGWGAMTMDMTLIDVDPDTIPMNEPIEFDLARDAEGMFAISAVRAVGEKSAEPAPMASERRQIEAVGTITAVNPNTGLATISHGPLKDIGMPAMTMDFALLPDIDPASLPLDTQMPIVFEQAEDMSLRLASFVPPAPLIEATGTIDSVDADKGMATISHGPMRSIGMPGMTMDFPLAKGLDATSLPIGQSVTMGFSQRADMSLELTQVVGAEAVQ
ncbi:efflux RND transporter periplasmic adaptor subunit [Celeribacter sp.]|uniref:efflux RND transporter periplasmic adaptor subunit n=1 Tax=Celeribacter sp. TaxID=1890673 RepID=UPI003A906034